MSPTRSSAPTSVPHRVHARVATSIPATAPASADLADAAGDDTPAADTGPALHGCATRLVAVAPLLMREFRAEMRRSAPHDLSVPLFRALILAASRPGATVSDLANHLGVTLPTASVAVGKLTARGLLAEPAPGKRRSLQLTPAGAEMVEQARVHTTAAFEQRLSALQPTALDAIEHALAALELALGGRAGPTPAPLPVIQPSTSPALQRPAAQPSFPNPPVDAATAAVDGAPA